MKIGDKVAYDELLGVINGETTKSWKILFDNGEQKTVRKTSVTEINEAPVEEIPLHVDESEEKVEVVKENTDPVFYEPTKYKPSKNLKKRNLIIFGVIFLIMAAVGVFVASSVGVF